MRYKFSYIDKIKVGQTAPLLFGDRIHKAFDDFHRWVGTQRPDASLLEPKLKEICAQRISDLGQEVFDHTKIPREDVYDTYCAEYLKFFIDNQIHQRGFSPENHFDLQLTKDFSLRGSIDLYIYPDILIDFKTSKHPSSMAELIRAFQTRIYALTVPDNATFMYLYVRKPFTVRTINIGTPNTQIRDDMIQTMNYILNTTEYHKTYKNCNWCAFKAHCDKV
jgi:hypothetical protein